MADTILLAVSQVAALFAAAGLASCLLGLLAVRRFARRAPLDAPATPITVLKPLCGAEPGLREALGSFCRQDHPAVQIVFGVQDPADPAVLDVDHIRAAFPDVDMTLVVDTTPHGMNRKVANLLNMLPYARHDVLVISDSDLHVAPDYLRHLQAALAAPGIGLVSTLYVGRPVVPGLTARLGAMHLSHTFLPGALLARCLGRQDCLGSTMALRRSTLDRVGGLPALSPHLADDNVLGQLVRALGLRVELADTVPVTGVQERDLPTLWRHELRWARTIRGLAPIAQVASALQYPIAWALLAVVLSGATSWALALAALSWTIRLGAARGIDALIAAKVGHRPAPLPTWLLPVRDVLSLSQIVASWAGRDVVWRGHAMSADAGRRRPTMLRLSSGWRALRDSNPRHAD